MGKPEPTLLYEAMHLLGSQPDETVMVGDGLGVDILAGKNAGTHTILLFSGTTSREDLAAYQPVIRDPVLELAAILAEQ